MKNFLSKKYLLIIELVLLVIYSAILFIAVGTFNKDLLSVSSFWGLYVCIVLSFLSLIGLSFVARNQKVNLNLYPVIVVPTSLFAILLGTILFIFAAKIKLAVIIIIYLIIFSVIILGYILGCTFQVKSDNYDVKVVKVINMQSFELFITELLNKSNDYIVRSLLNRIIEACHINVQNENDEELKKLEKQIFEYALFIEKDIQNNNVNNFVMNAEQCEKLLFKRRNY